MTGQPPRRGRPRSADADAAILAAAIDELVDRGFASMTIDGVATRAKVARTTVYRRFASLEQLCMEAIEQVRERLPPAPGGTVRDDLVFLLTRLNRILTTTRFGQILPHLAAAARRDPQAARTYWTTYLTQGRGVLRGLLERGIQEGTIGPATDIELIIDLFVGPLVHRMLWQVDTVTEAQIGYLVDTVLAGLRAESTRSAQQPATGGRVG